jgi:hypothetical protein
MFAPIKIRTAVTRFSPNRCALPDKKLPGSPALGGARACVPFPEPLSSLTARFLRCASDRFLLTIPITYRTIKKASVASLRRLIGFLRKPDRLPGGITVRLQRNPHYGTMVSQGTFDKTELTFRSDPSEDLYASLC